jgi:hypothetical protein
MRTRKEIIYRARDCSLRVRTFTIPKGTRVQPATNLSEPGKFWAQPWDGMSEEAESWQRSVGFLLDGEDLGISCQCTLNPIFCDIH